MKRRYALNLSNETLIAIGTVSAQWATLEYYMASTTRGCLQKFGNPESKLSQKTAFLERRVAFQQAFMWPNVPQALRDSANRLVDRITCMEKDPAPFATPGENPSRGWPLLDGLARSNENHRKIVIMLSR
jgi:hypothetical protein